MRIIGLTGSIGMGKSTTAKLFAEQGVPVHDADAAVHDLYEDEAVGPVGEAFPGTVRDGRIDRALLSEALGGRPEAFARLEEIVHPLVRKRERAFLEEARLAGAELVLLDIPLLFETGAEDRVDLVVVVSAPADIQRNRVLERGTMSEAKFDQILARQMPDAEKRRRADHLIETHRGIEDARRQVGDLLERLRGESPR